MAGGKGNRKGKDDLPRDVRISKACTQILRHKAENLGVEIRADGCVKISDLLNCKLLKSQNASEEDLARITASSDKQRFEIRQEGAAKYMRAVQGHSMKSIQDSELMRALSADDADLPSVCVHGTYKRHLSSIMGQGLLVGGKLGATFRNHIHFAPNEPGDDKVISGMRYDCDMAIWVDLREALLAGMTFFLSKNQVILTSGFDGAVPTRFFVKVRDLRSGRLLYPEPAGGGEAAEQHAGGELGTALKYYRLAKPALTSSLELVDDLAAPAEPARLPAAPEASEKPSEQRAEEVHGSVLRIPSPAAFGAPATDLLARLCCQRGSERGPFRRGVVYLHGFPDQSLDHRREHASYGTFTNRIPRKLAEAVLEEFGDAAFVAFNFAGTPGSDAGCPFAAKTVSREVADAQAVIRHLRSGLLPAPAPIHVVGLSTGAIVAALLRGFDPDLTITTIAGLVDVSVGLGYDFSEEQLAGFDAQGFCLKEFWLPPGSPSNPACEGFEGAAEAEGEEAGWKRTHLKLGEQYRSDFLGLDVRAAVGAAGAGRNPLLVVHGDADKHVPVENGEALFAAAAEPKELLVIKKGNHFLSSGSHFKKAANALTALMRKRAV